MVNTLFTLLVLMTLNLFSAKLFGELEFWFAIIKVLTILALIIVGIIMIVFAMKTPYGTASVSQIWSHGGIFRMVLQDFSCPSKWPFFHL